MAKLINADGTVTVIEPKNGKNFKLDELYDHIDCQMVQVCDSNVTDQILIFDEEFMCQNDPVLNNVATLCMAEHMGPFTHNVICGNAVLCESKQFD